MEPVPYDILEAMVQCFGKAFHYKDGVATFFLSQGVSRALVDKYRNEPKFVWTRRMLTELARIHSKAASNNARFSRRCACLRRFLTPRCSTGMPLRMHFGRSSR